VTVGTVHQKARRSRYAYSPMTVKRRTRAVVSLFALVTIALTLRLVWLQGIRYAHYRQLALDQRMRSVQVDPKRGTIYDRRMRELAVSISADSVYAAPAEVKDARAAARQLAPLLEMTEDALVTKLTTQQAIVWLKRKVPYEAAQAVKKLKIPGVNVAESGQRFYPKDTLAAQVLGIAGIDNQGLEGLERYYDDVLRGVRGQIVAERDAAGREIPEGQHLYIPPTDGNSLVLCIDEVIQYVCERELDRAIADTGSKSATAIAMDPITGEVLAMAMRPSFDPNAYSKYSTALRRNTAVCDIFEPGSTFKVVTAAAALDEGVVTPQSQFYDPGYVKVEDRTMRCWKAGGHGSQSFTEATENSCNPVFASVALKMGASTFTRYLEAFGLTQKTGIDFPGEATGLMHRASKMGPVELATTGFGQGISVTPIQLVTALSAVANGGYIVKPTLVKEIVASDGSVVQRMEPTAVRQVISQSTAAALSRILQSVVVNGSGTRAAVPGYAVAGKTGTAEKPEGGRYGSGRIASFMGFAPANDPKVALLVILDEPSTDVKYGGVLAAPVFSAIMRDTLRYLEIPPTIGTATGTTSGAAAAKVTVPDLTGLDRAEVESKLKGARLGFRYEGVGETAMVQSPKAGAKVDAGTTIIVYFGTEEMYNLDSTRAVVPDLAGKTLKEAALLLGARGLAVHPVGTGKVVRQQPSAGSEVARGASVTIYLEED
jgi:stage V sporulation protein D (sporulation-specific penicillin-binding protein)